MLFVNPQESLCVDEQLVIQLLDTQPRPLLPADRPAPQLYAGTLVRAVNDEFGCRRLHQGNATPAVLRLLGYRLPTTVITNGQLGYPSVIRYEGDVAIDLNVARHTGRVGVVHDIRRGLTHRQHQVPKLGIRPPMGPQPLAKPVSDQRQRRWLRSQQQLERGRGSRLRLVVAGYLTVGLPGRLMVITWWWRWHRCTRVPYPIPARSLRQRLLDRAVKRQYLIQPGDLHRADHCMCLIHH